VDIWSAGAVFASLLGKEPDDFLSEATPTALSPHCVSFLSQCLAEEPDKRLSSGEAEIHPWIL
jgi:serine/threonine protein kinase